MGKLQVGDYILVKEQRIRNTCNWFVAKVIIPNDKEIRIKVIRSNYLDITANWYELYSEHEKLAVKLTEEWYNILYA